MKQKAEACNMSFRNCPACGTEPPLAATAWLQLPLALDSLDLSGGGTQCELSKPIDFDMPAIS